MCVKNVDGYITISKTFCISDVNLQKNKKKYQRRALPE